MSKSNTRKWIAVPVMHAKIHINSNAIFITVNMAMPVLLTQIFTVEHTNGPQFILMKYITVLPMSKCEFRNDKANSVAMFYTCRLQ